MPLFSRFKNKGQSASKNRGNAGFGDDDALRAPPRWQSNWNSKVIVPEEVEELIRTCTAEMKTRGKPRASAGCTDDTVD